MSRLKTTGSAHQAEKPLQLLKHVILESHQAIVLRPISGAAVTSVLTRKLLAHYGMDWRLGWIAIDEANLTRAAAFSCRDFSPSP